MDKSNGCEDIFLILEELAVLKEEMDRLETTFHEKINEVMAMYDGIYPRYKDLMFMTARIYLKMKEKASDDP